MIFRNPRLQYLFIIIWCVGCTSHPPVLPQMPVKGETNTGFTISIENILPVLWFRRGLDRYTDIGLKFGLPLSGTGIDINRVLRKRDRKWDVLNIAYSISANSSLDFTYYMFKGGLRNGKPSPFNVGWTGVRCMIVPDGRYDRTGPGDNQSIRFGFLLGKRLNYRWGFEFGYFHDFRSGLNPENKDYPHKDSNIGWPTQYSTAVGLSTQLFMYLGKSEKKKK
ncbi:MAG: hypothetical protein CMG60_00530 [Candidatus Marinimicrobia bacterium]|nr:hypothetical protein [Candidatus Neomarinimicrobiota bacterium]|tara:strand:- start:2516 stop:3181 length:666 start_codon:yes stop_codon:yes gene_type:complete